MTTNTVAYSKVPAGELEVIFAASISSSSTSDPGFPSSGGASDVQLKCIVKDDSGAVKGTTFVSRGSPSAHLVFSYPGGSAAWSVEVSDVSHTISGLGSVGASMAVTFILIKK